MDVGIEALLTEREVARLLSVSVGTIRRRRLFREPPEFVKIGSSVRYKPDTIKRLIETATRGGTQRLAASEKRRGPHSGGRRNAG